ncbi:MAG: septum site-determining protein MinD, partial [Oscillospiraceae bacterium]|nr:septum site-determining protein MinD [Oscillospiraceae bacterium]
AEAAQNALVVSTPDPIAIRNAGLIGRKLTALGIKDCRLIINKYSPQVVKLGIVSDLDYVIDNTGVQLIGLVPADSTLSVTAAQGEAAANRESEAALAFARIVRRLGGEDLPLVSFTN